MRTSILLILVLTGVCFAKPYEFDRSGAGASIGYGILSNKAEFRELPGVRSCCPDSMKGAGNGWQINFYYDFKIFSDLYLGFSLGYQYLEPKFSLKEKIFVMDMLSDTIMEGEFTHYVNLFINNLLFQPYLSWKPFGRFKVGFAPFVAWTFIDRFNQVEQITKPEKRGTFLDSNGVDTKSRERNAENGKLPPKNKVFFGSEFFASYELPLNNENTLRLIPSFSFNLNFNKVLDILDWNIYRFNLGIRYDLTPPYDPAKDTIFPDSIIVPDTSTQPLITELPKDTTDYGPVKDSVTDIANSLNTFEYDTTSITDIKVITDTLIKIDTIDLKDNNDINLAYTLIDFDGNRLPDGSEIPVATCRLQYPMHYMLYYDLHSGKIPDRYLNPDGSPYRNMYFGSYYYLISNTGKYLKKKRNTPITLSELLRSGYAVAIGLPDTLRKLLIKNYKANKNNILTESKLAENYNNNYPGGISFNCTDSSYYTSLNTAEKKLVFDIPAIEFKIDKQSSVKIEKWKLSLKYGREVILSDSSVDGNRMATTFNTSNIALYGNTIPGKLQYEFMLWDSSGKIYREEGWFKHKVASGNGKLIKREYLKEEDLKDNKSGNNTAGIKKVIIVARADELHESNNSLIPGVIEFMKRNYPGMEYKIFERDPFPTDDKEKYYELRYFDELIELRYYK